MTVKAAAIYRCHDCAKKFRARSTREKTPACPQCGGVMYVEIAPEGPSHVANLSSVTNQNSSSSEPLREQQILAHYEIQHKIGEGGMGIVYKARDPQLERLVAIKVLRGDALGNPEILQRFRQEAESIARLRHPFIVNIYDFRQEGDQHYFAMDYVGGRTLEELIISGELTLQEKLSIFTRFLRALGHAHSQKVIHRDIKPSNLIVDEDHNPHITDFGLARSMERASRLTREGQMLGTPVYMAPEQLGGKTDLVDHRSDLYSAGVVFYQLLSGQVPYQAKNSVELFEQIISNQPVPMRALGSKVPRQIREICARALEKAPEDRYQDANHWADDLEPLIDSPRRRQTSRNLDLNPRVLAGLGCILLTLLVMTYLVALEGLKAPAGAQLPAAVSPPGSGSPSRPVKPAADALETLLATVKAAMNEGRFQVALDALVNAQEQAQREQDAKTLARLAKRLRGVLTFPQPINSFAQLSSRKTKQLCDLAWSEEPHRLEKLAGQLFGSGRPMIHQAATFKEGIRLLETAFYLGYEKPVVFLYLGLGYAKEKKYVLALERIDRFISFGTKQRWQGQFIRAQIYAAQAKVLIEKQQELQARVSLEKATTDFEAAIRARGPSLQSQGSAPARRQLFECYIRLGRYRPAMELISLYGRSLNQIINPFSAWAAEVWANWISRKHTGADAAPAYSWRFDRLLVEISAPILLKGGVCLIPRQLQPVAGPSRLLLFNPGRSIAELTFKYPTQGNKIILQIHGATPTGEGQRQALVTISVNGQTLIDRTQIFPPGRQGNLNYDITRLLKREGNNRVRIKLSKYASLPLWIYRLQVYGE